MTVKEERERERERKDDIREGRIKKIKFVKERMGERKRRKRWERKPE